MNCESVAPIVSRICSALMDCIRVMIRSYLTRSYPPPLIFSTTAMAPNSIIWRDQNGDPPSIASNNLARASISVLTFLSLLVIHALPAHLLKSGVDVLSCLPASRTPASLCAIHVQSNVHDLVRHARNSLQVFHSDK